MSLYKKQTPSDRERSAQNTSNHQKHVVDNRPEMLQAQQLQAMANNSPQALEAQRLQEMANNSPQAQQGAQLKALAEQHAAKQGLPQQKKKNTTGIPDDLKEGAEQSSGYSLDDVQVHRNSEKPAEYLAHALIEGSDIHLAPGQEQHLEHEVGHAVQKKKKNVQKTTSLSDGKTLNDNAQLEKEADAMGLKASNWSADQTTQPMRPLKQKSIASQEALQLMGIRGFNNTLKIKGIKGKDASDFKKWVVANKNNPEAPTTKAWDLIDTDEQVGIYYDEYLESLQDAGAEPEENVPQQGAIELSYDYLYAGNTETEMSTKRRRTNLIPEDITTGNTGALEQYLDRIKTNADQPNVKRVLIETTTGLPIERAADADVIMVTLQALVGDEHGFASSIRPIPVTPVAATTELRDNVNGLGAHPEMSAEEDEAVRAMHAKKLGDFREPEMLAKLYQNDSLAISMASALGGEYVTEKTLMDMNANTQLSGTNQELAEDTATKAGRYRDKEVALVDNIQLASAAEVGPSMTAYVEEYNTYLNGVNPVNVKGSVEQLDAFYHKAVGAHQEFIRIHPFNNANGRIARVLFYNLLLKAGLPLFRIDPSSETFKAMSGMQLKGTKSIPEMSKYLMELHILSLQAGGIATF